MTVDIVITVVTTAVTTLGGWEAIKWFMTWHSQQRISESEADKGEVEVWKGVQEMYQRALDDQRGYYEKLKQTTEEIIADRDQMKRDRDEMRLENKELRKLQKEIDAKVRELEREVARNGRVVEALRPFVCYKTDCAMRQRYEMTTDKK